MALPMIDQAPKFSTDSISSTKTMDWQGRRRGAGHRPATFRFCKRRSSHRASFAPVIRRPKCYNCNIAGCERRWCRPIGSQRLYREPGVHRGRLARLYDGQWAGGTDVRFPKSPDRQQPLHRQRFAWPPTRGAGVQRSVNISKVWTACSALWGPPKSATSLMAHRTRSCSWKTTTGTQGLRSNLRINFADDVGWASTMQVSTATALINQAYGDKPDGRRCHGISSTHVGGAHVAMSDGSVRFISQNISLLTLQGICHACRRRSRGRFLI